MASESQTKQKIPKIGEQQIQLLERLCNACSVSGDEGEVRSMMALALLGRIIDDPNLPVSAHDLSSASGCAQLPFIPRLRPPSMM